MICDRRGVKGVSVGFSGGGWRRGLVCPEQVCAHGRLSWSVRSSEGERGERQGRGKREKSV